ADAVGQPEDGQVGEDGAGDRGGDATACRAEPRLDLRSVLAQVLLYLGHRLGERRAALVVGLHPGGQDVGVVGVDVPAVAGAPHVLVGRVDAQGAAGAVGVGDVVGVAAEVLGSGLPVRVDHPAVGPDDLGAALAAVEQAIQVPGHAAQVLAQRRRLGIEG